MQPRLALVTGASAGLGAAFARLLARRGYDLALTARRADRLEMLAAEIRSGSPVEALAIPADLADPAAPASIVQQLTDRGLAPDVLINNAGYGLTGAFAETRWEDQARFLQVMVTAPCELAHRLLPGMVGRRFGRIVNVASLAGLAPGAAGHTLYGPAKSLMIKFSESLHLESAPHGVHVSALCPGFTYSEFHDVNGTRELVGAATPRWLWMQAEPVVEAGWRAVEANRAVCVPGAANKAIAALMKLIPEDWALAVLASQGRRFRKA